MTTTVAAPKACFWERARVDVVVTPAGTRQGEFGPQPTRASVQHVLLLSRGASETRQVIEGADDSDPSYKALRGASYTLQFAPDGHALALSTDGGKTAHYAALDAGDGPLYCRHSSFSLISGGAGAGLGSDPWAAAPSTRALVGEVLGSSTRPGAVNGRNHADVFSDETGNPSLDDIHFNSGLGAVDWRFPQELRGALRYALLHPDDAALRLAVVDALFRPGRQLSRAEPQAIDAVGRLAAAQGDVRARLAAQLGGDRYDRAALALSQVVSADGQDALGAALGAAFAAPPSDAAADRIALLAYSLAQVTIARKQASLPTFDVIRTVARSPSPCPPRRTQAVQEAVSGRGQASRRFMLHALLALGTPDSRELLTALAAPPCKSYNNQGGSESVLREDQPPPRWPGALKSFAEELALDQGGVRLDLSCWARAALASKGQ